MGKKRSGRIYGAADIWNQYSTIILLVAVIFIFSVREDGFFRVENFQSIVRNSTELLVIVMGLSVIMAGGGYDLSIGWQISLLSVLMHHLGNRGVDGAAAILIILITGVFLGLLNGVLVSYFGIIPFVATIATQMIYRGCSYLFSGGSMSNVFPRSIYYMSRTRLAGLRLDIWIAFICALVVCVLFQGTYIGKYIRAIGLSEPNAIRSGIQVRRMKCSTYAIAGLFYAVAAMMLTSSYGYAGSENGIGMEISAIAAACVGGIMGRANRVQVWKLVTGVLIIGIIEKGLPSIGVSAYVQYIFTGIVVVISMILSQSQKKEFA
ncbi:MAG: ABC transporter permease [Clostridiales bacterium]|nr:ABC transporter permease [Clostridiales bacterium]